MVGIWRALAVALWCNILLKSSVSFVFCFIASFFAGHALLAPIIFSAGRMCGSTSESKRWVAQKADYSMLSILTKNKHF